jgi:uncharacterized damage-inducible protein DinB
VDLLDRMLGHDAWATDLILQHSLPLTDAQLTMPFDIGVGTLQGTLTHQIRVIEFWSEAMQGNPILQDKTEMLPIAELIELHHRSHPIFADIARQAQANDLLDELFTDAHGYPQSQGGTILQLMYHNVQHRSECRHMLARMGVEDVWDGDPQEWEYVNRQAQ